MSETIYKAFLNSVVKYPEKPALMYKKEGGYQQITFMQLGEIVDKVAVYLKKTGIIKGDKVGIISTNRPEWAYVDLAVMKLGGIVVPIYPIMPLSHIEYVIRNAEIKLIFVEDKKIRTSLLGLEDKLPNLMEIVIFVNIGELPSEIIESESRIEIENQDELSPVSGSDISTIVYTSGTTGEPKGVMLTHENIVTNASAIYKRFHVQPDDVIVSYLPLCHMFERTCGYYGVLFAGATIAYAGDLSSLAEDVKQIKPTLLLAVPRVVEKAYEVAVDKIEKSGVWKQLLMKAAMRSFNDLANRRFRKQSVSTWLRLKCRCFDRIVASRLRKKGGGRLRVIACGGAPLDKKIAKAFHILGFNVVEGYGLTETSPIVCSNTIESNRLGTVGKPLDDVEIRIGENNEVLVRGSNVMKGYLNKPKATKSAIDRDGWFHTGDQGFIDDDGHLVITGRIKELIVTSYGKKVAPVTIESMLTKGKYIAQAVLFGDNRKYITALVVPVISELLNLASKLDLPPDNSNGLIRHPEIRRVIGDEIERINKELASHERIKSFLLVKDEFSVDNDLLTPTLKVRRDKIYS